MVAYFLCDNQIFFVLFTNIRHWSVTLTSLIHSSPSHPMSACIILQSPPHLCQSLKNIPCHLSFPTKMLYAFIISSFYAADLISLDFMTLRIFSHSWPKWYSLSIYNFHHPSVKFSLLSLNILVNAFFVKCPQSMFLPLGLHPKLHMLTEQVKPWFGIV
jgi:hypothetical protein